MVLTNNGRHNIQQHQKRRMLPLCSGWPPIGHLSCPNFLCHDAEFILMGERANNTVAISKIVLAPDEAVITQLAHSYTGLIPLSSRVVSAIQ